MSDPDFVDDLLARLRRGDDTAAAAVFRHFTPKLIRLAQDQIGERLRHRIEAEDVVQSVYRSFFIRCREGQIDLATSSEYWGLLTAITLRKCFNRIEHSQAQRRDWRRERSPRAPADNARTGWEALDRQPTPDEAAILAETVEHLLRDLDNHDRPICQMSLQGYSTQEISAQLSRAERTVQRVRERLRHRIHRLLEVE